ncbi:MAG: winged helix-turn-helix domain-containing protein [Nanoarchaeota archaeon]
MVARKTPEQIKKEILDLLFEGPKGINEIAERISSNWPTTNSYLDKLKEEGAVNEILITDKMKVYRRTDDPVYYSIPFNREIRTKTLFILREIDKAWKKERGVDLSKTALQKLAVDVIKHCNLNLPVLSFHYGLTTCASFDSSNQSILSLIEEPENKEEIIICIKEVINNKEHTGIAYKERDYQYRKYKMPFYLAKEELTKLFLFHEKDKETNKEMNLKIQKALLELSLNYPLKLERFYNDFEKFISNSQIILSTRKNEAQNLEIIKGTLTHLWDKLTTFTSFKDSESFIDRADKQLFEQIMDLNINFKEMTYQTQVEELESAAQDSDPFEINMPKDEASNNIQKLILESLESK